jgi:hypothetical protein
MRAASTTGSWGDFDASDIHALREFADDTPDFVKLPATMKRRRPRCPAPIPGNVTLPGGAEEKEPPEGGSKFSQGGVKQSGQEPLSVQKLDDPDNGGETLTIG